MADPKPRVACSTLGSPDNGDRLQALAHGWGDSASIRRCSEFSEDGKDWVIEPGKPFELQNLGSDAQKAWQNTAKASFKKIIALQRTGGKTENGWLIPGAAGAYGTNYLGRALIAAVGWPANLPEAAVLPLG